MLSGIAPGSEALVLVQPFGPGWRVLAPVHHEVHATRRAAIAAARRVAHLLRWRGCESEILIQSQPRKGDDMTIVAFDQIGSAAAATHARSASSGG